jgi:hypothetical protein
MSCKLLKEGGHSLPACEFLCNSPLLQNGDLHAQEMIWLGLWRLSKSLQAIPPQ